MSLILPKQVGTLDRTIISLEICRDLQNKHKRDKVSNSEFKEEIIKRISEFTNTTDEALIIKQSEIARYFGLIDNFNWSRFKKITEKGNEFLLNKENPEKLREIIITILEENKIKFGRNSQAVESSDSDVEPPKLILQSILNLDYCQKNEFAFILNQTHVNNIYYEDVLISIKENRANNEWTILSQKDFKEKYINKNYHNKFYDLKFINFFEQIGLIEIEDNKYFIPQGLKEKYSERINNLSIYNTFIYRKSINQDEIYSSIPRLKRYKNSILSQDPTKFGSKNPSKVYKSNTTVYVRDTKVVFWVLEKSKGVCEYCEKDAPFVDKDNNPYLEVHHVKHLSNGGSDSISNTVALCPNCHRGVHFSKNNNAITEELYNKIERLVRE